MGAKHAKLRQDIVDDLVKQTYFTEREVQDWYKGYIKDCPTGYLTVEEFRRVYSKFFPYGDASRFAEYVFRVFDRNRDGSIDFREFLSSLSVTSRGNLNQKLHWAFSMYDLDGDGYISRDELLDVLTSIYNLIGSNIKFSEEDSTPERRCDKLLHQMDTDRDGRLSFSEFAAGIQTDPVLIQMLTSFIDPHGLISEPSEDPTGAPTDSNSVPDKDSNAGRLRVQ